MSAGSRIGAGSDDLFTLPRRLLKHRLDGRWTDEHAKAWVTLKISLSLDFAIVLASGVGQFDTNPLSSREVGETDETDSRLPSVGQRHDRARGDLLTSHLEVQGRCPTMSNPTMSAFKMADGACRWMVADGGE